VAGNRSAEPCPFSAKIALDRRPWYRPARPETRQLQHTRRQLRAQQRARKAARHSAQPPPDNKHAAQPHN